MFIALCVMPTERCSRFFLESSMSSDILRHIDWIFSIYFTTTSHSRVGISLRSARSKSGVSSSRSTERICWATADGVSASVPPAAVYEPER